MPTRRTGELHQQRISAAGASYFVTCCTKSRCNGLSSDRIGRTLLEGILSSDRLQDTRTFWFTVMPDHCHWVFELGDRLSLGRVIARFKSQTTGSLEQKGICWQRDFYEHRLQSQEEPEDYALYVFLNPYRAGLLSMEETWPWWWTAQPQALRFLELLNANGSPPAAWIDQAVPATLRHGE
jgi:putative transposase